MSLQPGQSLAHYRIDCRIGEGGMGEVWVATDTRLQRPVALSHPNIAAVYGLERADDVSCLATVLAEGEDATEIALQVAAALEGAHDKGGVQRRRLSPPCRRFP